VSKIYQITHTFITKLLAQDQGVWVGNNLGELVLITLDKKQQNFDLKPFGKDILALEGDNNENVWISQNENNSLIKITSEGKMIFYGKEKGVSGKINVIRKAPNGDIYAGGNQDDNYFFKYNPEKDEFQNLSQKVYFEHNLPLSVSDLVIENDKTVWIATTFGLLQYKNNQITRTELGSMTDNAIKALAIDQNNNLWFASSHGLIKYLANTTIIFDESQGLPSKVVNFRCITVDKNNGIWAGTVGGIGYSKNIDPYKITPTPILVSIESNNEQILDKITQKIFSSEFDNKSYIKIQAVSIAYPARFMRYQMRLLGKKDEWIDLDKGEILLSGLEVGKYTLEIRAKQSGNYIWSSPMAYSFAIYQVWYSTWWAWLIFILIISVFVFAIIKFNNRRLLHEKHELEALIRERTYELQEQQSETLAQTAALQENNEKLNQKNDQLEQVNKELQSTLKRLQVMQGKLIQSEKMASMGQLTAGIAHEINNPINFIATGVETLETLIFDLNQVLDLYANIDKASSEQIVILLKEIKELKTKIVYEDVQQDIQQLLVDIQIGIKRTVDTIRSLRSLSRADSGEMRPVDLHENIESTLIILRSQYRDRIDIIKDYGQIPLINCASAAINQVLMNLLANAIQAIKDKGKIIISTKDIGDEVRISIKDSGKGMSKEIQKRIFEPFFTTKADGEGTGLGLSITKDIIRSHQGKIEVQSEEGEGTEFILFLPKIKK
ncbi:MAG: GHKL domain-containing protein, partial [Bacteroidetes bacterium]